MLKKAKSDAKQDVPKHWGIKQKRFQNHPSPTERRKRTGENARSRDAHRMRKSDEKIRAKKQEEFKTRFGEGWVQKYEEWVRTTDWTKKFREWWLERP